MGLRGLRHDGRREKRGEEGKYHCPTARMPRLDISPGVRNPGTASTTTRASTTNNGTEQNPDIGTKDFRISQLASQRAGPVVSRATYSIYKYRAPQAPALIPRFPTRIASRAPSALDWRSCSARKEIGKVDEMDDWTKNSAKRRRDERIRRS